MYNLTDKLKELQPNELANIYRRVFQSPEGQLVLEDLKNRCFMKTTPFTAYNTETNYNCGKQAVVLHIESLINNEPEKGNQEAP